MSTPTKSAKKWDDTMNSHLFLSICEVLKLSFSQEHKNAIVEMMTRRFGHDVNWNGIRQHLQKLKKKEGGNSSAPSGTPSVPATPKKAKPAAAKAKTPTPRNRKRQAAHALDNDEDEDEFLAKKKLKLEETDMDQIPRFGGRLADELATSEDGEV